MILVTDLGQAWKLTPPGVHQFVKKNGYKYQKIGSRSYLPPAETRRAMKSRGYDYKHQLISVQMLKGGVGKTSLALNIGIRASHYGSRVLLIDLDQQANLTFAFEKEDEDGPVWADLLENRVTINDLIREVSPFLHLVPSNLGNAVLDKEILNGKRNVAFAVSQYLNPVINEYDMVIIDTAPDLSAINTAAACASDLILLPLSPDRFSFDGLNKTVADLEEIKREFGRDFDLKVVFNKFDARETTSHALLQKCVAEYGEHMLQTFIRVSSEVKNCIRTKSTIFSKKAGAKEDFDTVTREILGFA